MSEEIINYVGDLSDLVRLEQKGKLRPRQQYAGVFKNDPAYYEDGVDMGFNPYETDLQE